MLGAIQTVVGASIRTLPWSNRSNEARLVPRLGFFSLILRGHAQRPLQSRWPFREKFVVRLLSSGARLCFWLCGSHPPSTRTQSLGMLLPADGLHLRWPGPWTAPSCTIDRDAAARRACVGVFQWLGGGSGG